jgi:hypothetical protein
LLHRNDKFLTVQNIYSKIATPNSVHYATCAKIASCSSELITFLHAGSSIQNCARAVRLVYHPFFRKIRPSSNPTNKNLTDFRPGDSHSPTSVTTQSCTCPYKLFFFTRTVTITPKILTFLPQSPYILKQNLLSMKLGCFLQPPDIAVYRTDQ